MRIRQLILETSELDTLREFYGNILNLPVSVISDKAIKIGVGGTELLFKQSSTGDPFYHFAINIPSNKIEEAKLWLQHRVKLTWIDQYNGEIADFINWRAKSVYFFDPAGNILELIARFDLENDMNEPFDSTQFLSVSEIGLVFKEEDVNQRTEELLKEYGLAYFDKQPPLDHFKAVGDDEGLFIIVAENRNWFTTTRPSGIFPLDIEFESNGKMYRLPMLSLIA
jgi:catechol-2,3-dioxygenase